MKALTLQSPLACWMDRFIALRRVSGLDYDSQARLLAYFDRFVVEQHLDEPRLTRTLLERYQTTLEGKFRKARYVPLAPSTHEALQAYLRQRLQASPDTPDSPLLINLRGGRLRHASVYGAWRQVLQHSRLADRPAPRPRLHDLRHTFAVHRLLDWYRDGQDLQARLPWLATYMGHVDILSTRVYLQATPELMDQVDRRFHSHDQRHVKPHGERS